MAIRGVYTDEEKKMLEEARELIGKTEYVGEEFHPTYRYAVKNRVATRDLIRNYAAVMGDDNPLWRDEDYARNTRWGRIIAPPFFIHCIAAGFGVSRELPVPPGMGRLTSLNLGNKWQFFKPVYVNDSFRVKDTILNIEDTTSLDGKGPRQFLVTSDRAYMNQRNEVVSIVTRRMPELIIPPPKEGPPKNWKQIPLEIALDPSWAKEWEPTIEELDAIDRIFKEEERRGANPRYWEDVNVGDEPRPVVHGPNTAYDQALVFITVGGMFLSSRAIRKECAGDPEMEAITHYRFSQAINGTRRTTFGVQRDSMLGHLVTNWMGDDGFLKRFDSQVCTTDPSGDARWCKGKVIKKYVEDGEHLVDLAVWVESIRGWLPLVGTATVVLPSRTVEG